MDAVETVFYADEYTAALAFSRPYLRVQLSSLGPFSFFHSLVLGCFASAIPILLLLLLRAFSLPTYCFLCCFPFSSSVAFKRGKQKKPPNKVVCI